MAQTLVDLAQLILGAALQIDSICKEKNVTFPSLDEAFTKESDAIRNDLGVVAATATLAAASEQLVNTAFSPARTLYNTATCFQASSALRLAATINVADVLRDAGSKGAHVNEIAEGTTVDPAKLARILRLLATRHIFREVAPDVFANNRISSLMDTGKPVAELRANPEEMHAGSNGISALVLIHADEHMKGGAYLTDTLTDPETAYSDDPTKTAINVALKTNLNYWAWLEQPDQRFRLLRFGMAMHGARTMWGDNFLLQGFNWKGLAPGSTVIDVGGGVGSLSLILAKAFPDLRLVVQDREATIKAAHDFWQGELPGAVSSGRVQLQPHDFFNDQPARTDAPAVFLMRYIVHDWADSYARRILQKLRDAAGPGTKLVLVEEILAYACAMDGDSLTAAIPGARGAAAPKPLLPNLGIVNLSSYLRDLQMLTGLNGQERTLRHFDSLLASAGWKLHEVHRTPLSFASQIVAVPM
ncbi:O-methyltransferase [Auricularia subglabra TFB-10046 SS5]|nr:O-methyltransferase [Auricularia subglabra TFB-10046 SS5]